jgi:hypothetical protein
MKRSGIHLTGIPHPDPHPDPPRLRGGNEGGVNCRWASAFAGAAALATCAILWCPPAFAADPTTADCLAASEASLKAGNEHHLRADRSQLLVCSSTNCPADIRLECLECVRRVDEVNAAIPTIIFEAKDAAGNDLSAVKVTMDGEVLAERLEGSALSLDPGEHTFVFETAGQPPLEKKFVIRESQKDRREAIRFGGPAAAPVPGTPPVDYPQSPEPSHGLGTQKILGIVAAGVGVVGLGVGSAFGLIAMSKKSDAQKICPDKCADESGVNAWSDAVSAGNVSTALFIVVGVGIAGAAVLWFTAPSSSGVASPQVGFGFGSVQVKGTW